ncbi:MAG TPA: hypothetical protein DC039_13905, partial [Leclercia adecarboxylata]|nr:hypothetical protein [Leclercia adecarboxylata]
VVAEGVETQEQQTFLTELGCTTLQGFLLGKPVSAQTINAMSRDPQALLTQQI